MTNASDQNNEVDPLIRQQDNVSLINLLPNRIRRMKRLRTLSFALVLLCIVSYLLLFKRTDHVPSRPNAIAQQMFDSDNQYFINDDLEDLVTFLPAFGPPLEKQYAGMLDLNTKADGKLFYWFFERHGAMDDENTPLVIWMNGGPGLSSMMSCFAGMGPYRFDSSGKLAAHPESWTALAHLLFIDQPVGTGYSSVRDDSGYIDTQDEMASQLYKAINLFLQKHIKYRRNPVYICGESYAGKYVFYVSFYIHVRNKALLPGELVINLHGMAIGNGVLWPVLQTRSIPDYAIALGFIDSQEFEHANELISVCEEYHRQGRHIDAFRVCHSVQEEIYKKAGNPFMYDVRKHGNPLDDLNRQLSKYFNNDTIRRSLHVPLEKKWTSVDGANHGVSTEAPALARHLLADEMLDVPIDITRELLNNYHCLFYAGNLDGSLSNNLGVTRTIDRLAWAGTTQYQQSPRLPWIVQGQLAGTIKSSGNLTYVVLSNSGQFVALDQPQASLEIIKLLFLKTGNVSS